MVAQTMKGLDMASYNLEKTSMQKLLTTLVVSIGLLSSSAQNLAASPASFGKDLGASVRQITEGQPTLAPMAHVRFCLSNPDQCTDTGGASSVEFSAQRRNELEKVNRQVNRSIRPVSDRANEDIWTIDTASGDCEDYVLTKRKRLLQLGWSSRSLRIAIAHTRSGEGHAVLVVKTSEGDVVLDNRFDEIKDWRNTDLRWAKIQSGKNPKVWSDFKDDPAPTTELVSVNRRLVTSQKASVDPFDTASLLGTGTLVVQAGAAVRVVDGATFQYHGNRYRLAGVEPTLRSATCQDNNGRTYACGLRKVKALSDAIRGKAMRCDVHDAERRVRLVRCTANSMDVAGLLQP